MDTSTLNTTSYVNGSDAFSPEPATEHLLDPYRTFLWSCVDATDNRILVGCVVGICTILYHLFSTVWRWGFSFKAPMTGRHHFWEPALILGLRFSRSSVHVLREGYQKLGQNPFKVRRNDCEVTIVPRRYVEEMRDMPEDRLSAMDAHIKNMVGRYTIGNLALVRNSDLHRRTIIQKLTPALGNLMPSVKDELEFAFKTEIPDCEDWTSLSIHVLMVNTVARIFARIFVGPELCRDAEWLQTSIQFTRNLGITRNLLRLLPSFLRPFAARLMPTYWRIGSNLSTAKRLLGPIIRERRAAIKAGGSEYKKPNDFLQWMMDGAREDEGSEDDLAHRQLLLSLASIHTTSLRVSHFFYDLCAYPEYVHPLREEIASVLREDRGIKKTTLNKLRKLDSFLKESQRLNPLLVMTFQRVVRKDITFKDGVKLPAGTHIAVASDAIARDRDALPGGGDPDVFDPFRYARLREDAAHPENINRYQFATTGAADLHFGHGIYACPGRFFASNEIKLIIMHLLLRYDFKYAEGQGRPKNLNFEEAMHPDPTAKVLVKRRELESDLSNLLGEY